MSHSVPRLNLLRGDVQPVVKKDSVLVHLRWLFRSTCCRAVSSCAKYSTLWWRKTWIQRQFHPVFRWVCRASAPRRPSPRGRFLSDPTTGFQRFHGIRPHVRRIWAKSARFPLPASLCQKRTLNPARSLAALKTDLYSRHALPCGSNEAGAVSSGYLLPLRHKTNYSWTWWVIALDLAITVAVSCFSLYRGVSLLRLPLIRAHARWDDIAAHESSLRTCTDRWKRLHLANVRDNSSD